MTIGHQYAEIGDSSNIKLLGERLEQLTTVLINLGLRNPRASVLRRKDYSASNSCASISEEQWSLDEDEQQSRMFCKKK